MVFCYQCFSDHTPVWFLSAFLAQVALVHSNQKAFKLFFLTKCLEYWHTFKPVSFMVPVRLCLAAQYRECRDCPKRGIQEILLSCIQRLIVILLASAGNNTDAEHPKQLKKRERETQNKLLKIHCLINKDEDEAKKSWCTLMMANPRMTNIA